MAKQYDLVVIGTGTAAMVAATRVRASGRQVAVIDFRPFGGTCALRGCDPKKMLIGGSSAIDHVRRMQGKGVKGDSHIDWRELMAFKRSFTDPVPDHMAQRYADKGIDIYRGKAKFIGTNTVEVEGVKTLEADHILIASGAAPVDLRIPGEEHLITSEEFLTLEWLPERIVLVGGGYIGAEFSSIAARAGVKVTIVQRGKRLLKQFDSDLVGWLMESFTAVGIDVRTDTAVERIEKTRNGYEVLVSNNGTVTTVTADLVVHTGGRKPDLEALNLAAGGIDTDNGRIRLNEFLQSTSNPSVYAAGDAASMGPPLTPVSSHDAKVVAANILDGNHAKPNYRGVPSVAFTSPPIASVGITDVQAKGMKVRVHSQNARNWFTARQQAEPVYGFKILIDEASDRILGAHLVGPHVDEVINIFGMAIQHGLTATDLKTTMFAYPTGASDIGYML